MQSEIAFESLSLCRSPSSHEIFQFSTPSMALPTYTAGRGALSWGSTGSLSSTEFGVLMNWRTPNTMVLSVNSSYVKKESERKGRKYHNQSKYPRILACYCLLQVQRWKPQGFISFSSSAQSCVDARAFTNYKRVQRLMRKTDMDVHLEFLASDSNVMVTKLT